MKIAFITGASSGLGAEFTRAVAEQGGIDEIWIVARRRERLEALAKECSPANVRPIPMDLTDKKSFAALSNMLREEHADIKILINNAGCCICGPFEDMPEKSIEMMINLDIAAMTLINKVCIPFMKKGSYAVIVGSVSSFVPVIGQAVYSAAKAYVRFLGQALHTELQAKGINILVLSPGNMNTEMNVKGGADEKAGNLPYLDLKKITRTSLKRASSRKGFYTPGWFYKGYRLVSKIVPHAIMIKATDGIF
jgi:short-subunit dehydrogenase